MWVVEEVQSITKLQLLELDSKSQGFHEGLISAEAQEVTHSPTATQLPTLPGRGGKRDQESCLPALCFCGNDSWTNFSLYFPLLSNRKIQTWVQRDVTEQDSSQGQVLSQGMLSPWG